MGILRACTVITLAFLAFLPVGSAFAQGGLRIAAIVNDEIISVHDLENRIALTLVTSNLENRPDVIQRLAPQMLRGLVDEKLKLQEARRLNIVVSQRDIDDALGRISRQINLPPDQIAGFLGQRGASMKSLIEQVEAEIAWIKTISRLEGSRVVIGEDEIDIELARISANSGQPEYRVAEIFLPVEDPAQEDQVKQLADRLLGELAAGASFPSLARNFSQAASAAVGGDLGWVRRGQLVSRLDDALPQLNPGEKFWQNCG